MVSNNTTDNLYFEWLYGQVAAVSNKNPRRSHWELAKALYEKAFTWTVDNDGDREEDGKDLRDEFLSEWNIEDIEPLWLHLDCSMFEMFVALSRRASFESQGEPIEWFWKFMENLGLSDYTDHAFNDAIAEEVDRVLERVINRQYERNGEGGIFPLRHARKDQRKCDIWYQLSAYILEGNYVEHGP